MTDAGSSRETAQAETGVLSSGAHVERDSFSQAARPGRPSSRDGGACLSWSHEDDHDRRRLGVPCSAFGSDFARGRRCLAAAVGLGAVGPRRVWGLGAVGLGACGASAVRRGLSGARVDRSIDRPLAASKSVSEMHPRRTGVTRSIDRPLAASKSVSEMHPRRNRSHPVDRSAIEGVTAGPGRRTCQLRGRSVDPSTTCRPTTVSKHAPWSWPCTPGRSIGRRRHGGRSRRRAEARGGVVRPVHRPPAVPRRSPTTRPGRNSVDRSVDSPPPESEQARSTPAAAP